MTALRSRVSLSNVAQGRLTPICNLSSHFEQSSKYGLKIGNMNVRSLAPSSDLVSDYVKRYNIDVICLTETWLRRGAPDIPLNNLVAANRLDRRKKKGGGVAIYCRDDLSYSRLKSPSLPPSSHLELIWIAVQCGHNRSLVIGCVYRPPIYDKIKEDLEALEQSIQKFLSEGKQLVLCGDLNCDILRPTLPHVRQLLSLINNVGLHQCVREPTRITNSSSTLIDIALVSNPSLVTACTSEDCIVSDHNFVIVDVHVKRERMKPKLVTFRRWKSIDFPAFHRELRSICWSPVLRCSNPDRAWQCWTALVVPILDRHAPLVTVNIRHKSGFGVSSDTRNLIRLTAAQLRTYRCSGAPSELTLYKSMRRKVRHAISMERRMMFLSAIQTMRSPRDTWNVINTSLGRSNPTHRLDRETARSFNEFFCSIGTNVQANVQAKSCYDDIFYGPPRVLSTTFELRPATHSELRSVIQSLGRHTASGPDGLSSSLFHLFAGQLASPLLHIFNLSICSGVVPSCWKIAEVVPIFKGKGDPKDASNYRPISLLNVASKILERLVSLQLRAYLDDCCALSDEQFGFRPHHSVDHALITLSESIRSSIDNGDICILASLDLSRAFDSVNHTILIEKLCQLGIDQPWFTNYLSGRTQFVRGCYDVTGDISSGVIQGSVLGPTLFNIFVNDLPTVVSGMCSIIQYADDIQVMVSGPPQEISVLTIRLQVVLRRLAAWFHQNRLQLNVNKSQVIMFGSRVNLKRIDFKSIDIFGAAVSISSSIVSLGVTFDSCLTWHKHIDSVIGKSIGMLLRLSLLRRIMPLKIIVLLINTLVLPHLRFCLAVWGNCNATQSRRVNKVIKFAKRIAGREVRSIAWYGDTRSEHHIAVLKIVRQCLLYPESMPVSLVSLFKTRQSQRRTRQWDNLDLPMPKTEFCKSSLSYTASKLWNDLPSSIRNSSKKDFIQYIREKADAGDL